MSERVKPQETSEQPWPEDYPKWFIEVIEYSMEETGMTRKEAEEFLQFELLFGSSLMQGYVAKLKAHQEGTEKPIASR